MSEYYIAIENEYVVKQAAKGLAEDEFWSGNVDKQLWARSVALTKDVDKDLMPVVSEDGVYNMESRQQKGLLVVVDVYCRLRGMNILAENERMNTAFREEIKRVKGLHKLRTKHYQLDHINYTSRHSGKYFLVLLVVTLIAVLIGGNGG